MSTQAYTDLAPPTMPDTEATAQEAAWDTQDPTPAQAAEAQAARASRKSKEATAGRAVSNATAEEKRGRHYSPYQKRGEETNGDQSTAQNRANRPTTSPPPEIFLPPVATPPAPPTAQPERRPQNQQPLAQLPARLAPQPGQPHHDNPTTAPSAGQPIQDVEMGAATGGANTDQGEDTETSQPENPHLQTTMAATLTTVPPRPGKGYAGGPFPRTIIDSEDLFKSIRSEILQNLLADPQDFLLLLPYGAGKRLHAEFPNLGDDILEYLNEFRPPNCERLAVVKAASDAFMKGRKPKMYKRDFEAPWVFILSGFSAELKDFLLGVGVFDFVAGEANHAFTVLEVKENVRSWHVAYLKGDGVAGDQQTMDDGLAAIKKKLKDNTKVRASVLECYTGRTDPHMTSTDDKVQHALSTLAITFTTDGSHKYWHLTARPITDDPTKHDSWLKALRDGKSFVLGRIFAVDIVWGFERERKVTQDQTIPTREGTTTGTLKELPCHKDPPHESDEATRRQIAKPEPHLGMPPPPHSPEAPGNKRKRDEGEHHNPPTTAPASRRQDKSLPPGCEPRKLERTALRKDKGKEGDTRPVKRRKEHIPCQPPTIREGTSTVKLSVVWTVEKRTVWEGENRRDIVQIQSSFAEQVKGAPNQPNPHWTTTKPSQPPTASLNCAYPITAAAFPNVALTDAAILGNVRKEVADELRKHHDNYLALLPIGAGNELYQNARELTTTAADLINALANDGTQYTVAAPVREGDPPYGARFAKPFAMILREPSDALRHKLLKAKTIAFRMQGKGHAFIATEIQPDDRSWVICNYKGSPVTNDIVKMVEALKAIGDQVISSSGLRAIANRILKEEDVGRTAEERIHVVAAGLSLVFIDRQDENRRDDPVWQLHGRPLTKDEKKNREWLRAVRQVDFFLDATTVLVQERKPVSCVWCKSETHASPSCPLPLVKDWLGPPVSQEALAPEPRDTKTSREGKRESKRGPKGRGKGRM
ncbi:hypothetical protein PLEOSDRAFT_165415 [Pleurotus ostreatus PC15]|uniref:Uncharacterized protein n=1 Tax=Pleurotus ostreatus (strain PC15) TaxID=1137138 RepID=A0A067NYP2_PLEO1|nr:hypothetical protein PLEOSDRAFT_165415 [Pleurotus ostreatus PC15]